MKSEHSGPTWTLKGVTVMECEPCGYVHLWPLPTQAELDALYRDEYYQTHNAGWFEKEAREQWYWQRVYRQRMKYAWHCWDGTEPRFSVLDLGAGCGWFVKAAAKLDGRVDVIGVEPNVAAHLWAIKHKITTRLVSGWWTIYKEDFIHLSLMLEHPRDPLEYLFTVRNQLAENGFICIIVPNEFNPLQRRLARWGYSPLHPHHVNYFTPDSLTALVERAGFEVIRRTATFPIEWFALHGLNYIKHPKLGLVAHWIRMATEAAALSIDPDRWERRRDRWAQQGIGREIELWARKRRSPA